MNKYDLYNLCSTNASALSFFTWLNNSEVSYDILGVSTAEERSEIDYYDLVTLFKKLDTIGAGDFIVGRKGHDSRISWKFDTKHIARVGLGEQSALNGFFSLGPVPDDAIIALHTSSQNEKSTKLKHSFNLRKDFEFNIELPTDFDGHDLKRLKNWLDLLVY